MLVTRCQPTQPARAVAPRPRRGVAARAARGGGGSSGGGGAPAAPPKPAAAVPPSRPAPDAHSALATALDTAKALLAKPQVCVAG
jgi:hypothetical protein